MTAGKLAGAGAGSAAGALSRAAAAPAPAPAADLAAQVTNGTIHVCYEGDNITDDSGASQWDDTGPNADHATQATPGLRFTVATVNGEQCIQHTDYLTEKWLQATLTNTTALGARPVYYYALEWTNLSTESSVVGGSDNDGSDLEGVFLYSTASGKLVARAFLDGAALDSLTNIQSPTHSPPSGPDIYKLQISEAGANSRLQVYRASANDTWDFLGETFGGTAGDGLAHVQDRFRIGSLFTGAENLEGRLWAAMMVDAYDATDDAAVLAYMYDKWVP